MTNYEKIKQMSVDELVAFLQDANCYTTCVYQEECQSETDCNEGVKKWLESEAEND